jgi:hypothetical protein
LTNTTLPLVVLTWLCQLVEEYFYKIGDINESGDWNAHRKYCLVKARNVSKEFPLDNIHMIKANSTAVTKITSVQWIEPDIKNNKKVIKSFEEWAAKILCWDIDYVKNKANADDETKKRFDRTKKHGLNQYAMLKRSYKPINQEARNNINIVNFAPQQQQQKTPDQLFLHLGDFMKGEIETMTKTADKKMQSKKTSNCSAVQMKWLHALLNLPIKTITKSFHHLEKCKHT